MSKNTHQPNTPKHGNSNDSANSHLLASTASPLAGSCSLASSSSLFPLNSSDFVGYLNLIAMVLITVSMVYLVASNWFMIPSLLRIVIPMCVLLAVTALSTLQRWSSIIRHSLHVVAGVMIGLTLASIGQVYQTGADSYQLFLVWGLLLTPWLVYDWMSKQPNTAMFVLWCVVSQLALGLYFKQTFLLSELSWAYVALVNLFTLLQFALSLRYYPKSRYIMLAWIAVIAIASSFALIFSRSYTPFITKASYSLSMFAMSSIAIAYFYRHKQQLETVLAITGLSLAIMFYLIYQLFDNSRGSDYIGLLLGASIIVFAEFSLLAYLFLKLFKNKNGSNDSNNSSISHVRSHHKEHNSITTNNTSHAINTSKTSHESDGYEVKHDGNYHIVLLAIGAWIAGLFFSAFILMAWDGFSLIASVVFLLAGIFLINKNHDFSRHLGYCLAIAGQSAIMFHLLDEINSVYVLLPIQAVIFAGVLYFVHKPHWLYIALQILASYWVLYAINAETFNRSSLMHLVSTVLLLFVFYALLLLINKEAIKPYIRSIFVSTLALLAFSLFLLPTLRSDITSAIGDVSQLNGLHGLQIFEWTSYLCATAWFVGFIYLYQRQQHPLVLTALTLLALTLTYFGYFEVFILLMIIAWSLKHKDKLMLTLAIVVLSWGLWQLYYHLHIGFLYKSLTIFISGLLVFLLAKTLSHYYPSATAT